MTRIAFTGLPRVGKDTAGEYLCEKFHFRRLAFGDYMKEKYFELFPHKKNDPKDREGLIAFGQTCVEIDNRVWIRQVESRMGLLERMWAPDGFIITDLRQDHEYEWAKKHDFTVVEIMSHKGEARQRELGEKVAKDIRGTFKPDMYISNVTSVDDFHRSLDTLMEALRGRQVEYTGEIGKEDIR
ncbi:hypothetical protein COE80_19385 [Bacillus pseudomycoides]|uniref:hypothetical protein n=1 Tax=Bacillus pseudomycoides TaxID=64104 RepID=UPI000BFDBC5A|nr:hypothetical protein [Bacillus pseudomycoides]PHB23077.1 hypothetical protein COE80_19385 [Bacillus pseudomycoides]PHE37606.1 hypothetical protein COF51_16350 [Bacillus pseudomycoides]